MRQHLGPLEHRRRHRTVVVTRGGARASGREQSRVEDRRRNYAHASFLAEREQFCERRLFSRV